VSRRVVVVDDEPDIREIAALSLETLRGWTVVPVASGVEAVEVIAREQPDAVLLDVMMPGQDGPATLAALRARADTRDVPVVFLTAKAQVRLVAQLHDLGSGGVMAKSFDPTTLGDQLAELLGWQ
jgi:CheY-like chemotaxis protein